MHLKTQLRPLRQQLGKAVRVNEKGDREDGRANLISGAVTCQAVINGLFGVSFELNRIKIKPINHAMIKGLSLTGVSVRGRTFDIEINKKTFAVTEAGKEITKPLGEEVIFNLIWGMMRIIMLEIAIIASRGGSLDAFYPIV